MKTSLRTLAALAAAMTLVLAGCGARDTGDDTGAVDASGGSVDVTYHADGSIASGSLDLGAAVGPEINFELFSDATTRPEAPRRSVLLQP